MKNFADKQKKINVSSDEFDVKPFLEVADGKDWTIIDLRPLRPLVHSRKLPELPKGVADLIWGYDAILLMTNVKAATLFE